MEVGVNGVHYNEAKKALKLTEGNNLTYTTNGCVGTLTRQNGIFIFFIYYRQVQKPTRFVTPNG
jgi:hypothetical protein